MNRTRRPSAALVVAVLALLVAATPPAVATAQRLAAGSVGTRELRNYAVTGAKLHGNAVRGGNVVDGSLTRADLAASARPRLPRGYQATDDSWHTLTADDVSYLALTLPAGRWAVVGKGIMTTSYDPASFQWCHLVLGATPIDFTDSYGQGNSSTPIRHGFALASIVSLAVATPVSVQCRGQGQVGYEKLLATEVG